MINKDNRLFDFLNYILKQSDEPVLNYNVPNFLVNRWLSMTNAPIAKLINLTTNKWFSVKNEFNVQYFYRAMLPKFSKRISYIKKPNHEKDEEDNHDLATLMECSIREIEYFKNTLAEIDNVSK